MNVLPAIGVYGAIRREKREPFSFPGGPSFVWEAADADLVADVMVWAAQSPQAANEAFNITNGDVFEWRRLWPAIAETLGVETGPDMPIGGLPEGKRDRLERDRRKVRSPVAEPARVGWSWGPACRLCVCLRRPGRTSGFREHHQVASGWIHKDD